ncbi:MAG: hypothetical protein B6229_06215 [Spirochaetaceae bacterium 4572_7]|nr:MAG: hypothetical protein B6229_06215 [Spirochaetaceae bacterium 4572_7]
MFKQQHSSQLCKFLKSIGRIYLKLDVDLRKLKSINNSIVINDNVVKSLKKIFSRINEEFSYKVLSQRIMDELCFQE